jgi:hypothetical protein
VPFKCILCRYSKDWENDMELKPFQLKFQQHVVRGKEGHTRATDFCILTARRTCVTRYGSRLEKIMNVEECVCV